MKCGIPARGILIRRGISNALSAVPRIAGSARLSAAWDEGGAVSPLDGIVSFTATTSFSGTYGVLTLARPADINPRTGGAWWDLLVPNDAARVKLLLTCGSGVDRAEVPLMEAVPIPGGMKESYGARELVDLGLEDVTGAASRVTAYTLPSSNASTADPHAVASSVLGGIPYLCLYDTGPVDGCLQRFPNALMAADDVLIRQQDAASPLTGARRARYGDREGCIVYRTIADPVSGAPFPAEARLAEADFAFNARQIARLAVEERWISISLPFINPWVDLAARVRITVPRAALDEIAEVQSVSWSVSAGEEHMTLKCRREYAF